MAGVLVLFWAAMRSPLVQTQIADKLTAAISQSLNTEVKIGKARYSLGQGFSLQSILVRCQQGDTLLYIPQFTLYFKSINIEEKRIDIQRSNIKDLLFCPVKTDTVNNFDFLLKKSDKSQGDTLEWTFSLNSLAVTNATIRHINNDTLHLFDNINIGVNNFVVGGNNINAHIESLTSRYNNSGFIRNLSLNFSLADNVIKVEQIDLKARSSKAMINNVVVDLNKTDTTNFLFSTKINNLLLVPTDFAELVPFLKGKHKNIKLSGYLNGSNNHINGKKIKAIINNNTIFDADFDVGNISHRDDLTYNLTINELNSSTDDILTIISEYSNVDTAMLANYIGPLNNIWFNGLLNGNMHSLTADGHLNTGVGNLLLIAQINQTTTDKYKVNGRLISSVLRLQPYTQSDTRLKVNLETNGTIDRQNRFDIDVDGSITDITYSNRIIDSISINGNFCEKQFAGRVSSYDPKLRFDFNGLVKLGENSAFNFESDLYHADLYKLGFVDDSTINLSLRMKADFKNTNLDLTEGSIMINDIFYCYGSTYFATDSVAIVAHNVDSGKVVRFKSEFINAEAIGKYQLTQLPNSFRNFAYKFIANENHIDTSANNTINLTITADYPYPLTKTFFPWLSVASGTTIKGHYNDYEGVFALDLNSNDIVAKKLELEDLALNIHNHNDSLVVSLNSDYLHLGGYETMKDLTINSTIFQNQAAVDFNWDNNLKRTRNSGDISTLIQLSNYGSDQQKMRIEILPSIVTILDTVVTINPAAITFEQSAVVFNHVDIDVNDLQSKIYIDGILSDNPTDSLLVNVDNVKLGFLSNIFGFNTHLDGFMSGKSIMKDLKDEKRIDGDLKIDRFAINRQLFGDVALAAAWDIDSKLLLVNGSLSDSVINSYSAFGGYINPKKFYMNLDLNSDNQNIQFLSLFLSGVFSEIEGTMTGDVHLEGKLTAPNWYGKMALNNTKLTLLPTQASYSINDTLEFVDNKILFKNVYGGDFEQGEIGINGQIWHRDLSEFNLDLKFNCNQVVGLNTRYTDSPLWYGKCYCSGLVDIIGSTRNNLNINISAHTMPKTMFYITMEGRSDLTENDFISFKKNEPININTTKRNKVQEKEEEITLNSTINLNLDLEVTREAEVQIVFDPSIGDALRANGTANLNIRLIDDKFSIYGTYLIDKGDFTFTLQNVISKRLDLQSGSSVTWAGDPLEANIDIDAAYKIRKVPVYSLTMEEDDKEKRVPVNCHLLMTNKLVTPTINFSIEVPSTTSNVEVVEQLNNLPEDELTQQVIYLLMLNKFAPLTSVTAPMANNFGSSATANTASELLSNQLSRWISQISTNFDLGVAYRPETEISSEEYEIALSTSLWDDRIIVNSNFDVSGQEKAETNTNQYTTDISFEFKLNKKGNVRLKAFQKVNEDLIYDDAPYTRGLGVFYTEDFNDVSELWHRWFRRRDRKTSTDTLQSK